MNTIEKLIIVILFFTGFSIISFTYKRKKEIRNKINQAKFCAQAQKYFVTICYKMLTSFGDEKTSRNYKTFFICSEYFFVFQKKINGSKLESKMIMCIRFADLVLIDQWNNKVYSYGEFERYLSNFLGDSLVYDSYIKKQWGKLQK